MMDTLEDLVNDENITPPVEIPTTTTDDNIISFTPENFYIFITIMSMLSKNCTDLHIVNGEVRQDTNNGAWTYYIDFTEILGDVSMLISQIGVKADLLYPFVKQHVSVELKLKPESYVFYDSDSKIEIYNMLQIYAANTFIPENEYNAFVEINSELFTYNLKRFMIDRIASFSKGVGAYYITVDIIDGKAHLLILPLDDQGSRTVTTKITTIPINENSQINNCRTRIHVAPILLSTNDIQLTAYSGRIIRGAQYVEGIIYELKYSINDVPITVRMVSNHI